ncbi:response regulator [Desulfobacterales bacterium HSG16]|nr:response regulator [Desulfobacterales bacterium HSG16]
MNDRDEKFIFDDELMDDAFTGKNLAPWKIMIVDDENAVHETTMRVLGDFSFEDRGVRFLNAFSAEETKRLIIKHPDTAIILLDVVMETDHAGLELVRHIREELGNRFVRIILRTGQPGKAPEKKVIIEYDISDYKTKTELTAQKLFTAIISSLRSYRDLGIIRKANEELKNEIYERKKAEKKLAILNARLEELVDERTKKLAETTEQANAASKAKSQFLARMSHEIRTPLNGIIGLTNLILKSDLTSRQDSHLKKVRESSNHLLYIINDLLDFSRIEEGKFTIDTRDFMLNHVINKVADIVGERSAEKKVELFYLIDKAVPLSLTGDPLRLNQILINLMGNAVKFTEKGEIILKVQVAGKPWTENGSEWVKLLFSVRDTGIGISPEQIENLFHPFTQADGSVTRKYGGTGLGLSICLQLVDLMKGRIWAESVKGKGSTFFFTLPFALQSEEKRYTLLAPKDVRGLKVMVIDDNEAARIIFKDMLEAFDSFQITVADSGEKALDILKNALSHKPYDMILLDWKMPVMDGFEVVRRIRSDPVFMKKGSMPKIIMVTMYGREDVFQRTKTEKIGIDAFLYKPVSSSAMFNSVMDVFGQEDVLVPRENTEIEEVGSKALAGIMGARILLVEDNEINRDVALALLEEAGLITEVAKNGLEAVEMVRTGADDAGNLYDAVIMDIEMPEMGGYEATRIIRNIPWCKNLPVIAMTAHAMKGDREKCMDAGMNEYTTKPIDEQHLYAILCKWIKPGKRDILEDKVTRQKIIPEMPSNFLSVLPCINLEAAAKRLRYNEKLIRRILQSFLEKYGQAADDFRKLLDEGRIRDAQRLIHSIKGISGNLCADDLFLASQELDAALKQEKAENIQTLTEAFEQKLTTLITSLKSLESEEKKAMPALKENRKIADMPRIEQVMKEMYSLLKKKRLRAWELPDTLLPLLPDAEFHEEKMILKKSVPALDTQKAFSVLSELADKLDISLEGADDQ